MRPSYLGFSILCLLPLGAARAEAPTTPAKKADADYAKDIRSDMEICQAICVDENTIALFGGVINVPLQRPSVEQCGIWMSSTPAERAADAGARRREADAEATRQHYSPREKEELRKRTAEPMKKCEADFHRRCAEVRQKLSVETRKKAVAEATKEVGQILDERRRIPAETYLKNVLAECPLGD